VTDQYLVGIESVDQEHRFLIDLYNDLVFKIETKNTVQLLEVALEKLFGYADYHFTSEERVMQKVDYPDFERHHGQHEGFIQTLTDMFAQRREDDNAALKDVAAFVSKWILSHILVSDKALGAFVAAQHSAAEAPQG
jgi:hemerythrin